MTALYAGTIRHRRFAVRRHAFRHRIALAYVDVDAPPKRFRRSDHLGGSGPLREAVEGLIRERGFEPPGGEIRLLANLRGFNPVAFFYCFDADGRLGCLVAEVTNTPWGERHTYVFPGARGHAEKALHVSPFFGMDHEYELRASVPGETIAVHIESRRGGRVAFDATLNLRRRPFSRLRLAGGSARTLTLIYAHGLALKLKGVPHHPHPRPEVS